MKEWSPKRFSSFSGGEPSELVVDNRVFLLGLDYLYREAMKVYESRTLLGCAQAVAGRLGVAPSEDPVEGYYSESPPLEAYFRLMRALQKVSDKNEALVNDLPAFQLLWELTNSPLYGHPVRKGKLLPVGRDPLSQALRDLVRDAEPWHVEPLVERAAQVALEWDDCSLVGLASRVRDAAVIAALRESVVLYAEVVSFGIDILPENLYHWEVDPALCDAAGRFITAFHHFVPGALPPAAPASAEAYYLAYMENEIVGRCVRIGDNNGDAPYYHWAVAIREFGPAGPIFQVDEFWSEQLWTTDAYRESRRFMPGADRPEKPVLPDTDW